MNELNLRLGGFRYDTTAALFDGTVAVDGAASTTMVTGNSLIDVFNRAARGTEVDASEFGLTFLLRALDAGEPYVAIPAFPVRMFRHSSIFVNTGAGIENPADLVGKRIGEFGVYGQDPGVWMKGILADDHGFAPERNSWIIGELNNPGTPFGFTTHPRPGSVDISDAPADRSLSQMLVVGEIDALFTANAPQPFLDRAPEITRLFLDYEDVERDYFRRTNIFPIMHAVVMRRSLLDAHPGLARALYDAFTAAKNVGQKRYRQDRRLYQTPVMLPWANSLFERNEQLFDHDWWPYGIEANRSTLDTFLTYHYEQGLTSRRWGIEDIFAPEVLDT